MDLKKFHWINRKKRNGYRLINSKYPPKTLFDDVADADEFEAIYAVQSLTNPRILNELGDLNLLPYNEIPFGIDGCNYATAPFTHANPDGSRFADGSYGILYLAKSMLTAIEETVYHQERYFKKISGLHYDTLTMRGLKLSFSNRLLDITDANKSIYDPDDYTQSQALGREAKKQSVEALQYESVRDPKKLCWALFTPERVMSAIQTKHYEYVWNGKIIASVNEINKVR
ncbi:MAG: RES family NAD+ phosphorylase [Pseudomonadales bacterium]|nr:RES family NAD+ phosphorylase [Pseudomonadales bacterium]